MGRLVVISTTSDSDGAGARARARAGGITFLGRREVLSLVDCFLATVLGHAVRLGRLVVVPNHPFRADGALSDL